MDSLLNFETVKYYNAEDFEVGQYTDGGLWLWGLNSFENTVFSDLLVLITSGLEISESGLRFEHDFVGVEHYAKFHYSDRIGCWMFVVCEEDCCGSDNDCGRFCALFELYYSVVWAFELVWGRFVCVLSRDFRTQAVFNLDLAFDASIQNYYRQIQVGRIP